MYSLPYGSPQRRINNDIKKKKKKKKIFRTNPGATNGYGLTQGSVHRGQQMCGGRWR
jgi:hypothetical protein